LTERTFAHVCETGGARRCWLHGMLEVSKRYLLQVAARNLGLLMRKLFGMGTPRGLQKEFDLTLVVYLRILVVWRVVSASIRALAIPKTSRSFIHPYPPKFIRIL
jgi:hypothetical protein